MVHLSGKNGHNFPDNKATVTKHSSICSSCPSASSLLCKRVRVGCIWKRKENSSQRWPTPSLFCPSLYQHAETQTACPPGPPPLLTATATPDGDHRMALLFQATLDSEMPLVRC